MRIAIQPEILKDANDIDPLSMCREVQEAARAYDCASTRKDQLAALSDLATAKSAFWSGYFYARGMVTP
jgi:hypothetical protein